MKSAKTCGRFFLPLLHERIHKTTNERSMTFKESKNIRKIFYWVSRGPGLFFAVTVLAWGVSQAANGQQRTEIEIWPNGLPAGAAEFDAEKAKELIAATKVHPRGHILFVDTPTLTVYRAPEESANGAAVVVCPGGGYNVLAWQHEGVALAEWFNSIGVTAFVLKYRVPRRNQDNMHWEPMQDVQRAVRLVRHDAKKYKIDDGRIGVLGFSAGGHLTIMSAVQYDTQCYPPIDEIDAVSARPDFVCPIYAAYLGDGYGDDKAELSALVTVTPKTPPMFMAVTWGDKMRGAQSALLLSRLKENNVPAELHVYQNGGHGYGIYDTKFPVSKWHHHLANWLEFNGYLKSAAAVENP
jgi:acetyl esterase/lipase